MARSLEAVVNLLERNLEDQHLELSAARAAAVEGQLNDARANRDELVDQRTRTADQLGHVADSLEFGTLEVPARELERSGNAGDHELELLDRRLRGLDRQISLLDSSLGRYQRELHDWQALVGRRLFGR
jgi:predicted  nucleic acid-binding Zn-ribbon protein